MKATIILAAFATIFSVTPALAAQNLVVNGGFETGDFSGWDQFGDTNFTGVYDNFFPVADGQFSAAFGPDSGYGGITQTIDTYAGKTYNVSFELANTDTAFNNVLYFSFDDGFQINGVTLGPSDFGPVSFTATASGLSADVTFFVYNPVGYFLLDDVSVTPIPEPATWSLLLTGFAMIGATMRRRKLLAA